MELKECLLDEGRIEVFQPLRAIVREMLMKALGVRDFTYSPVEIEIKRTFRRIFPVPKSPWTNEPIEDKSVINLVPPEKLRPFFRNCIDILRQLKGDDIGDYLEFGVFNGSSMASMHHAAKSADANDMRFFGFDAFEGLPPGAELEDDGVWQKGFYACSFEEMQRSLRSKGVDPDAINWVKGWYEETLRPETAETHEIDNIAISFIDCDTYSSAKSVLDFLAPLVKQPAIFCFDDWKLNDLDIKEMGEYKAFNEFLRANPQLEARELRSYNRKSKTFLIIQT